jgi:D-inositol-3-phosphate glycosyltransferase
VFFLGAMPPDALRKQYIDCDLFVLASEQETAPVSIAEALAAGRPVLTTDVGGCGGMVTDGVTGRVTPARDPASFARAAIQLLADPRRLAAMGQAAHAAAEARFRLDAVVSQTLTVYETVMAAAKEREP